MQRSRDRLTDRSLSVASPASTLDFIPDRPLTGIALTNFITTVATDNACSLLSVCLGVLAHYHNPSGILTTHKHKHKHTPWQRRLVFRLLPL